MTDSKDKRVLVSLKHIRKVFGRQEVLTNVSLDIQKGEIFVIVGGSGSGKSTLLRIMTGGIEPTEGQAFFGGQNIQEMDSLRSEQIKRRFGMSFQSSALLDFLSVEDNVALPLREHTRLDDKVISIIARMKLALVGLKGFENYMPSMLSGGMRKRVGLARAIAMDPEVVFYDEPTAGLDPVVCAVVDQLILDLTRKLNLTSVVVTHNMESVFRIADRVAFLYKGRLLQVGRPMDIKHSTDPIVQQFISGDIEGPIQINS